jgi:hypothetical protein
MERVRGIATPDHTAVSSASDATLTTSMATTVDAEAAGTSGSVVLLTLTERRRTRTVGQLTTTPLRAAAP